MIAAGLALALAVLLWPPSRRPWPVRRVVARSARPARPLWFVRRRRPEQRRAAIAGILRSAGPALRAGVPPATALGQACRLAGAELTSDAAFSQSLVHVADTAEAGGDVAAEFRAMAVTFDIAALEVVAASWSLSDTLGCSLGDAIATASGLLAAHEERHRSLRAAIAGPRATMQLLTFLPVAGIGIAALAGVAPAQLYSGTFGVLALVVGGVLIGLGRWWTARMIAGAGRSEALS